MYSATIINVHTHPDTAERLVVSAVALQQDETPFKSRLHLMVFLKFLMKFFSGFFLVTFI